MGHRCHIWLIKVNRRHPIVVCTLGNKDNAINTTIFIIKAVFVFIQNAVYFEPWGLSSGVNV